MSRQWRHRQGHQSDSATVTSTPRRVTIGDLTAVIGDNDAKGEHRAGYNGLWSLTHKTEPTNVFVPTVAGMNFEHVFDGETLDPPGKSELFFEPRNAKMT